MGETVRNHKKYRAIYEIEKEALEDPEIMKFIRREADDKAKSEASGFDFHSMTFSSSEFPYHNERYTVIFEYRYWI